MSQSAHARCHFENEVNQKMPENAYCDSGSSPPMVPEPFASADEAARFLSVKRRYLLTLARTGLAGAYALGTGTQRKTWVFRLSELAAAIAATPDPQNVRLSPAIVASSNLLVRNPDNPFERIRTTDVSRRPGAGQANHKGA